MTGRSGWLTALGLVLAGGMAPPAAAQPPDPVPRLKFVALPDHVHPQADGLMGNRWVVVLQLITTDANGMLLPSPADLPVKLSSSLGTFEAARVVIRQGQTSPEQTIELTSAHDGEAAIYAWPDVVGGALESATLSFHLPRPTRLTVRVDPERGLSIGRTGAITVVVQLQDDENTFPAADRDITVTLASPAMLDEALLKIVKGESSARTHLSATRPGRVEVTASAPDLKPDTASARFVFPVTLLLLAGLGGVAGTVYRSTWHASRSGWQWLGGALPGVVPGVFAYGLAAFVPTSALPSGLEVLAALPATSSLGAVVIGLFGGYCGRRLLQTCVTKRVPAAATA